MGHAVRRCLTTLLLAVAASWTLAAQQPAAPAGTGTAGAFEQYERVRAALSADKVADVEAPAKALAAMVEPVGGTTAAKAAAALAAAKTLDDARTHFGELSVILVPIFEKAAIPGATAFMCPMRKQPWMQKGDKTQNPYYGSSMPTCGTPLPAKK